MKAFVSRDEIMERALSQCSFEEQLRWAESDADVREYLLRVLDPMSAAIPRLQMLRSFGRLRG